MLREFLTYRLPEYLVPTGFKVLDRFPLNANGKVDRNALPGPDQEADRLITPPRGATEERLAEVWRLLLPPDNARGGDFDRDDSFFALGGNSLLAARLMFRIGEEFDVEVRMAGFYETPTLAACAAAIEAARPADGAADGRSGPAVVTPSIGRRDRSAYRKAPQEQPSGIARRDRSAYRKAAPPPESDRPSGLAPHLVRLTDDWALWRTVCLRGAGFPIELLAALGDVELARAADAVIAIDASDPAAVNAGPGGVRQRLHVRSRAPVRESVRSRDPAGAARSGRLAEPARADDRHRPAGPAGARAA